MENGVQGEYRDGVITISPTAKDQRVTLDLGPDYPKLLADAVRRSGKAETGKDTFAYQNVSEWHYFVNDILFAEQQSEKYEPYRVTVNIKQRPDGMFVYSFSAENETRLNAPQTLHAAVDNGIIAATDVQSNNSITNSAREVKESGKKSQSSAPQEEHRTLLHELQHSVQEREGRPVGASPDYWRSRGEADPYGAYRDTAGEIEARQTEQRGALTSEERRQKTPDFGWDRAVFAQDDGINYEIKYPHYTREQIEENSKLLHGMDTVSVLTGQEFAKGEVQLKDQVLEFFHQLGNNVHSEQFGDVGLVKSSWRSDLRHGMTNEKAISFVAVPDVIQKGVVIDVYSPGPNTYDRIVVAAPITIAGKDYYMAVMLQWDQQSQRLYLHDVIAKEKQGMQNHTQTGLYANDGNEVSRGSTHLDISSILRNALNYNHFVKNTSDVQSSIGLSYDELVRRARERYPKGAGATADGNASPTDGILRRGAHHTSRSERRVPRGVFGAQPSDSEALSAEMNDSRTAENAIKQATGYGEYGVRAISDLLNTTEGMSFDQLKSRFQSAYEAGLTDMPVAKANLSTDIQRLAFNAGKQDYIMSMKREKVKGATVWGKAGGVIENDYSKKLDAQTHDTLHTIGRATGTKIIIEELPAEMNANGYYKSSDGTIHIDVETTDPVMTVAKHEITHRMQELAPEAYTQFRDYAVQMENRGAETGNLSAVEVKQEQYRQASGGRVSLAVEEAMDEIAANYTEKILRDENTLHDFVREMSRTEEKRSVGQKFFDAVHEFLRKLKEHFGKGKKARAKMDAEAVDAFGATVSELERAERLWKKAYGEAVQAAQSKAGQAQKNTAQTDGEVQYSLDAGFSKNLDEWIKSGKKGGGYFRIGTTSEALQSIGVKDYEIFWDKTKIAAIMSKHPEMTQSIIAQVPQILENPVMVLQSNTVTNRVMVFGELKTADGSPVMAALELRPQNKRGEIMDFAKVASAYGRTQVQHDIDTSDILYLDPNKNRTNTWAEALRLQLPAGLPKYGSIGMVTYVHKDVNGVVSSGEGSGKTAMQAALEKAMAVELSDRDVKYSLREKDPPKKTGIAYKVFMAKNGQLYPPMVANPGGEGTPVGVWLDADVAPRAEDSKTGRPQVQAGGKGTNAAKGSLAFRPGWHLGDIPQATQFARKNPETGVKDLFPANFVWCECEYAMDHDYQDEAMSYGYTENGKFRHSYAGLPKLPTDGYYRYRTNPNPDTVPWVITGAMKVKRILTDAETDAICRENGVEPMKRQGGPIDLAKLGLEAGDTEGKTKFSAFSTEQIENTENKNPTSDADIRFSLRDAQVQENIREYQKAVDTWDRTGRPDGETFVLGMTGDVLQGLGAIESDIYILSEKLNKIMHDHPEMTLEEVKRIPEILEDPVLILESRNANRTGKENTRLVLFGTVQAKNGQPILSVLDLRPFEGRLLIDDMQKVNSAYTKDTDPVGYIARSGVLYADKKRTIQLLRRVGFHMPTGLLRHGSIGSITYDRNRVKFYSVPMKDILYMGNQGNFSASEKTISQQGDGNKPRFSLKGQKELERENAKLRETVAGLREQFRRTKFAKVDRKALDAFAKTLLKDYQSGADVEETRAALDSLYTYLANGEDGEGPVWGEAYRRAFETAADILEAASVTEDEVYRQYSRLRRYLREQKMHVPREMWSDLGRAGGYNALRRAYMGRLSLSSKDGAGIDQVYQELSQMYPEFFDEAEISNPADQLLRIADVLDGLEPYEVNPYSANMRESASWLANDILERFYELPQAKPTFADKAEGRLTDQVIRDGKKLEKLRGQKNARIAQLIAENRQKVKEAAARERQKRKREVDELKATVRTLQHMLKAAQDGGVDSRTMDAYREKVLKGYRGGSDIGVRLAIMSLEPKDRQAVLAEYEKLVKDYGAIPAGEKPAREVQVPKKTAPGKKVSQTVRTVLEAGATPEGAIPTIEQMVADGTFSYDAYTDEQAMADAGSTIERDGFETALSDWLGRMMRGEVSKKNTAMGWALYNNAANAGDVKTAITVLNQMASMILMGRYMQRRTAYPEMFISTFWIRWTRWISRRKAGSSAPTRRTRRRRRSGS